ncbi:hypothetical protein Peur_009990 [Populus x canadensis]
MDFPCPTLLISKCRSCVWKLARTSLRKGEQEHGLLEMCDKNWEQNLNKWHHKYLLMLRDDRQWIVAFLRKLFFTSWADRMMRRLKLLPLNCTMLAISLSNTHLSNYTFEGASLIQLY